MHTEPPSHDTSRDRSALFEGLLLAAAFVPALVEVCLTVALARVGLRSDVGLLALVGFVAVAWLLRARPSWCRPVAEEPCAEGRAPRMAFAGLLTGGLWLLLAFDGARVAFLAREEGLSFGPPVDNVLTLTLVGSAFLGVLLAGASAVALLYLAIGPPRGRRMVA